MENNSLIRSQHRDRIQHLMRAVSIVCVILGGIAGALALITIFIPSWFYETGDEHMAWAIRVFGGGLGATVIGCLAGLFSGRSRWLLMCLNLLFLLLWVLSEVLRVNLTSAP
ncbi:MAG: hypothetical protein ABIQ12_11405 [Opitutaceae bacterium]